MRLAFCCIILLLLPLMAGCCAPSELFSCIDRNCYVADWTNHHSCVSCCCCKHGSCRRPAAANYPMLVLGDSSAREEASEQSTSELR
jgi:hypothetical protein